MVIRSIGDDVQASRWEAWSNDVLVESSLDELIELRIADGAEMEAVWLGVRQVRVTSCGTC